MAIIFVLVILVLLILKSQKLKEQANSIAKRYCQQNNLQFLDGTVAFRGLHYVKWPITLVFRYGFEYSDNSVDRYSGTISFIGNQLQQLFVAPEHLKNSD